MSREDGDPAVGAIVDAGDGSGGGIGGAGGGPAFPRPDRGDCVSIAPMMDWTTRHYRWLMRRLTKRTRLYTEMIVDKTLLYTQPDNLGFYLDYEDLQHPIAAQLGGNDPDMLARATKLCEQWGYDEVDLNCGCPSDRVSGSCFGARMMLDPELVRDCTRAMVREARDAEVTIKCRLGADDMNTYEELKNFIEVTSASGVRHYIIHARICLLSGLSTRDNRTIPPLKYHWVYQLAREFPDLRISINGGVSSVEQMERLLAVKREDEGGPAAEKPSNTGKAGAPGMRKNATRVLRVKLPGHQALADELRDTSETSMVDLKDGDASESKGSEAPPSTGVDDAVSAAPPAPSVAASPADVAPAPTDASAAVALHTEEAEEAEEAGESDKAVLHSESEYFGHRLLDSVMVGRYAYNNPWAFADVDRRIFGVPNPGLSRREVVSDYLDYVDDLHDRFGVNSPGNRTRGLAAPIMKLFVGEPGGGRYRAVLSQPKCTDFRALVEQALDKIPDAVLDVKPPV